LEVGGWGSCLCIRGNAVGDAVRALTLPCSGTSGRSERAADLKRQQRLLLLLLLLLHDVVQQLAAHEGDDGADDGVQHEAALHVMAWSAHVPGGALASCSSRSAAQHSAHIDENGRDMTWLGCR
jgi:hypothetical protein